jgi:hypothetical protein
MESLLVIIGVIVVLFGISAIPLLILRHQQNKEITNSAQMYSREFAEALVGKKIDWDK